MEGSVNVIIYTAIFNDYDDLPDVKKIEHDFKYICFTDSKIKPKDPWTVVPIQNFYQDPKIMNGYVKANSHLFFDDPMVCWIDSNLNDLNLTTYFITEHFFNVDVMAVRHFSQRTVGEEINHVIKHNKEYESNALAFKEKHKDVCDHKISATMFLLRRHIPKVIEANKKWWELISSGLRRDQVTFNYAFQDTKLYEINLNHNLNQDNFLFTRKTHKQRNPITIDFTQPFNENPTLDLNFKEIKNAYA